MADGSDALVRGVRKLFRELPKQSALRRPLSRILLDELSDEQLHGLDLGINEETVKRYRSSPADLTPLLAKRYKVDHEVNASFDVREKAAEEWIVSKCGVTQSGRVRTVFKTELAFNQLFCRYQDEVADSKYVSINIFARIAKRRHVHFGVGAVDTMTCVNCRDWVADIENLEDELLGDIALKRRRKLDAELKAATEKLHQHHEALIRQRRTWSSDLDDVQRNAKLLLCVVDFSTFALMDRKTTSVFCVVVIDNVNGSVRRRYYDFVDVHLSGRKRDIVFFAISVLLKQRDAFMAGQHVRLWSDAGSGDFRNAPCLYSCLQLNTISNGIVFESFSFFGARHGWNDCDRHFGTGKQVISRWLVTEASRDNALTLDVAKCAEILASLQNTIVLICTKAVIAGADHEAISGLTKNYYFRFVDAKTAHVAMFSDEKEFVAVAFRSGRMMRAEEAKVCARARKLRTTKTK